MAFPFLRLRFANRSYAGYNPDAVFKEPVYLDEEIQNYLSARADSKGIALSELVNSLLKKDIELIEAAK